MQCVYPAGPPKRRGADKAQRIRSPIGQRQPRKLILGSQTKRKGSAGAVSASGESANSEASSSVPGTPDD